MSITRKELFVGTLKALGTISVAGAGIAGIQSACAPKPEYTVIKVGNFGARPDSDAGYQVLSPRVIPIPAKIEVSETQQKSD